MASCSDCGQFEAVNDSPRQHPDAAPNAGLCVSCYAVAFEDVNGADAELSGGPDAPPRYNEGDEPPA